MEGMNGWWESLPIFLKALWIIAVPSTVLTLLQAILEVFGAGHHAGADAGLNTDADMDMDGGHDLADHDAGGLHLFSFKGVVIFFTAFSWIGIACVNAGLGAYLAAVAGIATGLVFMFLFAWIFYGLHRMEESGNADVRNALMQRGETYLRVPEKRSGRGKVMVTFQGGLHELTAMTDGEMIPTGAPVRVVEILDSETVLVTRES